ncbi:MAG TPA: NAD(P)/FAD-dependent oxidoreductase [Bryobacteraceae bacterium]|nr:NAD(P)/FAD-dependent oxidoreductase [Bryobacteraceae bacterium]
MNSAIVIGAGMGGLAAAVRLARRGFEVTVLEARADAGGLASSFETDGFRFDAGPYVLLDRPGLEWAFRALDLDLAERVDLRPVEEIYEVASRDATVSFYGSAERTAAGFDRTWPGSGVRYLRHVESMGKRYRRLRPLQERSEPGPADMLGGSRWLDSIFLHRSLGSVLAGTSLPKPVQDAIAIWTHVAGQSLREAPSPMGFVSSLIHTVGCYYPAQGMGSIPQALADAARQAGVQFRFGTKARTIRTINGAVRGAETEADEFLKSAVVVSNHNGIGTYLNLVDSLPTEIRRKLSGQPLQSPGVCAYLAVQGHPRQPYLRFRLPETGRCRLLISPAAVDPGLCREGWSPARLLGPMDFDEAQRLGQAGQQEYLDQLLAETWWREGIEAHHVLATRTPSQWGAQFHLHRDSMNPVMTARFMRAGRLAHRSPHIRGLYLTGSSTHPGQWVSFCAISGILAANCVIQDLA